MWETFSYGKSDTVNAGRVRRYAGHFLQKFIGSLKTSQPEKVKFGNFFEFIVNWFIEFMQIPRDGLIAEQSF